ncbi:MAG: class I tRNA ligase family protein, partial [Planctomycetes bacterium]|nr:class I tRNA ligase family protein [Planctomycetota bacterium]
GGFVGEPDIFDTWFTSSLTPQIGSGWLLDTDRHGRLFPGDVRPQSHEIIRTWAFYTIAKALLHEDTVPWHNVLISGWILDPDRKKMSKSIGNVVTPTHLLEQYTADAVRYWAASARLGVDTAFDDKVFKIGKRLVTKLFNASKFVLSQSAAVGPVSREVDRAFVAELAERVARASADLERYEFGKALQETESFFWTRFTDTTIELLKTRARSEEDTEGAASAVATLRLGLSVLLRLFAPVVPYITEEVWSWAFADETGVSSIHVAPWPGPADFEGVAAPEAPGSLAVAIEGWRAVMKAKADAEVGMGREIETLDLAGNPTTLEQLAPGLADVLAAVRCQSHRLVEDATLEDGVFEARNVVFAPKPS